MDLTFCLAVVNAVTVTCYKYSTTFFEWFAANYLFFTSKTHQAIRKPDESDGACQANTIRMPLSLVDMPQKSKGCLHKQISTIACIFFQGKFLDGFFAITPF